LPPRVVVHQEDPMPPHPAKSMATVECPLFMSWVRNLQAPGRSNWSLEESCDATPGSNTAVNDDRSGAWIGSPPLAPIPAAPKTLECTRCAVIRTALPHEATFGWLEGQGRRAATPAARMIQVTDLSRADSVGREAIAKQTLLQAEE
jgi:hypothetical protein